MRIEFNSSDGRILKPSPKPPHSDAVEMDRPVAPDSPPPAPAPVVDDDSASIPWHYIDASGETRGPVSFRVIRAQMRCAMLPPDAMVWREGLDEWCEARVFPAFASCVEDDAGPGRLDATSRPATAGPAPRTSPRATMPNAPATATPALGGSRFPGRTLAPAALFADAPPPPPPPPTTTTTTTSDDASSDDAPAWFAVDAAGTQVGPMDTAAMLRLVWRDGSGVLTRSEPAQPGWIPARDAPALREAIRTMESARAGESVKPTGGDRDAGDDGATKMNLNLSPESLRAEAESLRAALETTRAKLLAKEAEAAALRETVRHLRVRIATGGRLTVAGDAGAMMDDGSTKELDRAELEAAELARARRELEDRTAELVRLKGVLRGELLRRVLEDAETTRTSLGRLDVATDD